MNTSGNNALALTKHAPMTLRELFSLAGVTDRFSFDEKITVTPEGNPEYEPYKHQIHGLNLALSYNRFGLYDEPACGKTLPSQAYCLYHAGLGNKVVVVMPPVLLEQFSESFEATFQGFQDFFKFHILNQGPKHRYKLYEQWKKTGWPDILCMTYQMFSKLPRARKNKKGEIVAPPNPLDYTVGMLKGAGYCALVCDEAHALKNPASDTHKAVAAFLGDYEDSAFLPMTGTPVKNTLLDTYGLIKLVTPEKYTSFKSFERTHCIYERSNKDGREYIVGFRNKDVMSVNLYARARRITKDMVFSPKKPVITEVPVVLDPAHSRLYEKLVTERFLEVKGEIIDAVTAQSLRQKCLRMVLNPHLYTERSINNQMLATVDGLLDSVDLHHEKVVLFVHYQDSVKTLAEKYLKYNPALIYGGSNSTKEKNKFLRDDSCRLLIANVVSGGVGLNLQSVSATAIFVEPTSVPGDFKQALERLRVGHPSQKRVVSIYILKALKTLAPKLTRAMLGKERDLLAVTRDRQSMLAELLGQ